MTEYILMGVMAAVLLLLVVLRSNAAICFLALCSGKILLDASGDNAGLVANSLTSGMSSSASIVQACLVLVPMVVVAVLLRGSVPKALVPLGIFPAIATVVMGAAFVVPLLADSTKAAVMSTQTWEVIAQYQEPIVALGIVISVVLIALTSKKAGNKHDKKAHH